MNVRLLIDGIVRQTTVLIAQLSTTAGVRAPPAKMADQVFIDLAREIEAQGVARKVAADMFGYVVPCADCAFLSTTFEPVTNRVQRGGYSLSNPKTPGTSILVADRSATPPGGINDGMGLRCARSP
jgi:hypothetical protein